MARDEVFEEKNFSGIVGGGTSGSEGGAFTGFSSLAGVVSAPKGINNSQNNQKPVDFESTIGAGVETWETGVGCAPISIFPSDGFFSALLKN